MSEQDSPGPAPDAAPRERAVPGLLDRTLGNLRDNLGRASLRGLWRDIAGSARGLVEGWRGPGPRNDVEVWRSHIQACLSGRGGDVSARARAADLGRTYLSLDRQARRRFLLLLATDFDVDRAEVDKAVEIFHDAADPVSRGEAERRLRHALEPGRLQLLMQFNALPEGVKFLVEMREELLTLAREEPALAALEADLKGLLKSWFDVGFLELRRITWESPAALLEKLIRYEAVHAIAGWQDLKDRLDSDRRCFGFFHPRMPDEPLIFVEVALVAGMAASIQALLDPETPAAEPGSVDTAIFYSISNAQQGLAGISFGNFLIKQVVALLQKEFPNLRQFATLSPIPGLRRWLDGAEAEPLVRAESRAIGEIVPLPEQINLPELLDRLQAEGAQTALERLRPVLQHLCAAYLLRPGKGGRARDPVAHFHLTNGARVERLNWLGDLSPKGWRESFGLMVNYAYQLSAIDDNHEAYRGEGRIIASSSVRALLRSGE